MSLTLDYAWRCLNCEAAGEGPNSNREAEKHGKENDHSTQAWGTLSKPT